MKQFPDFISYDTPPKKAVEPLFNRNTQFREENTRKRGVTLLEHLEAMSQFKEKHR